jgi:hypothetical protein
METEIKLLYKNPREAKAVAEAVSPDNVGAPDGLSVQTSWVENTVTTKVRYDGGNFMTFLSTIDDILSCVSVAEKAFIATKKTKRTS